MMRLVPCELEPKEYGFKKTKNFKILNEFIKSGMKCAQVEGYPQKTAHNCACSFRQSIKHFGMNHIFVITRKGKVYLINDLAKNG